MSREIYGILIALTITVPPSLLTFFVLMQMMQLMREIRDAKVDAMIERRRIMDLLQEVRHARTLEVTAPALTPSGEFKVLAKPVQESNPATIPELAKIKISEEK